MRAELQQDGTLIVGADTPVEAFALARWCEVYFQTRLPNEFSSEDSGNANFSATISVDLNVNGGGKP